MPLSPPESPQDDFLDIELSGSPYQLYTPGSKLNGSVIFSGPVQDALIEIEFVGVNKTRIVDNYDKSGTHQECYTDEAILFHYHQVLHGIGQHHFERFRPLNDNWNRASSWPFCFRFPSITESRRTVAYKDIIKGGWTNARHSLPPSFDTSSDLEELGFYSSSSSIPTFHEAYSECKVEYALTAKVSLSGIRPKILKLPIQFMPFAPVIGLSPRLLCLPQGQFAAPSPTNVEVVQLDSLELLQEMWAPISGLSVLPPTDVRIGQAFTITGIIILPPSLMSSRMLLARYTQVHVSNLVLVCKTTWRAIRRVDSPYDRLYTHRTVERQHEEQQTFSLTHTAPVLSSDHPGNGIKFSFDAGRRSQLSPSFGSFLIANSYNLRGHVHIDAYGYRQTFAFEAHDIPVVSSVQSPVTSIRQLHQAAERRFSSQA